MEDEDNHILMDETDSEDEYDYIDIPLPVPKLIVDEGDVTDSSEDDIYMDKTDPLEVDLVLHASDKHAKISILKRFGKFFHAALLSENCTLNSIKEVARKHPSLVNDLASILRTPLHYAISIRAPLEIIHELLLLGANVNFVSFKCQESPLMSLVNPRLRKYRYHDRYMRDVVKLLISYGADPNIKDYENSRTPLLISLDNLYRYRKGEENMVISVVHALLKGGAKFDNDGEYMIDQLEFGGAFLFLRYKYFEHINKCLIFEVMKLLLEFNTIPVIYLWKVCSGSGYCFSVAEAKLLKLIMQYLAVHLLSNNSVKIINLSNSNHFDEIVDLIDLIDSESFEEMFNFRKALFAELIAMIHDKIDENNTLFSFISVRCSSGLTYCKTEYSLLSKVLSEFYSKNFICCNDLFYAAFKQKDLFCMLCNLCISVKKPVHTDSNNAETVVQLNHDTIKHLASYLSKRDALNLIMAFSNVANPKKMN